jgi:multiple sugar transport system substrate-binding protein
MKTKLFFFTSVLLAAAMLLSACGGGAATTSAPTQPPAAGATTAPAAATSAPAATTSAPAAATTAPAAATTEAPAVTQAVTTTAQAAGGCPLKVEDGAKITFSGWGDETEQKIYRDSISRFNAVCPSVSVDYVPVPDKFQDKMKAQMAAGTAPDVFYVDDQLMTAFASSGQLLALDDLMSQAGVSQKDFIPALMSEFTLDGKTYALPKDWGTLGLIYLPEAFQDAGIPEPTADWTWDDMRKAAKTIADKGKYGGFCMAADWARFAPFVLSNGGDFASSDNKTATLDTPEVTTMATLVSDMQKEKSLVQPSDVGASWCGEAIGKKLVAMTTEGGWMVNFMKQTYPDVQWKAVLIPQGPKTRADIIFTNGLGVNASTKYPMASAALDFYITGSANQAEIVKTGFAYSTHPDQINLVVDPNDQAISKGGLLPDSRVAYWGPYSGKLETAVSNALSRVFLGDQDVATSFAQAQQEAQAALNGQ